MIEKRGGKTYNKNIINFQNKIKKIGLINNYDFLKNICIRLLVSSCPGKIRLFFYKKKLRK